MDNNKNKTIKKFDKNKTLKLCIIGMLAALTIVATLIFQLPMPATEGYLNFGDSIIFITSALLGGVPAMLVGGIGSAIADLIVAPHWAPLTLIIKGLEGLFCGLLLKAFAKINNYVARLIAMIISGLWMVIGYYFAGVIMGYGWAGSLLSLPGNLIQAGVSIFIAYILVIALNKIKPLNNVLNRMK